MNFYFWRTHSKEKKLVEKNKTSRKYIVELMQEHLWAKVLAGLFLGLVIGTLMGPDLGFIARDTAEIIGNWVSFPGYFFLAVVQMVVIPLIVASVICGIASGDSVETASKLGIRVIIYFVFTTAVAVSIGSLLAYALTPGMFVDQALVEQTMGKAVMPAINSALIDGSNIPGRVVGLIPKNPFASIASGEMLQVVLFAAVLGAALIVMPRNRAKPVLDVLSTVQEACMVVVSWIMKLAPLAVFGLVAQLAAKIGADAIMSMAVYMGTVLLGLLAVLVFYMVLVTFFTEHSPASFLKKIREAQLLAFSTSSSAATMPVTLRVAEEKLDIQPASARFVIPLGTTINMDGTALYQAVATVFLAQVFNIDLGIVGILLVLVTAIAASIGTPGTPGVGIVVLASILVTVGIPPTGIAVILGVDRILDMCRTTINVTGDLVAASVMDRWLKHKPESEQA